MGISKKKDQTQKKQRFKTKGSKKEGLKEKGFFIKIPQKRKRVQEQRV